MLTELYPNCPGCAGLDQGGGDPEMSIKGHQPSLLMPKEFGKNVFLRVSSREKKRFSGPGSAEIRSRGRKSKIVAKQSPISQVKSFKLSWLSIASILEQKESKLEFLSINPQLMKHELPLHITSERQLVFYK